MSDRAAYIYDYIRTPFGRAGGALASIRPDDLAAATIAALVERNELEPGSLDDVVLGCANQAGEDSRNVARNATLLAGLPVEVPGQTVNRLCASGLQAIVTAAHAVCCEEAELVLAGGVESMTRAPLVIGKAARPYQRGSVTAEDSALGWRFANPSMPERHLVSLGETAENVAERHAISRADQDEWALRSHRRAVAATEAGEFAPELVTGGALELPEADEGPRATTTTDALGGLRPAFAESGTVTAGNSSPLNDGAALLLIGSAEAGDQHSLRPLARVGPSAVAGVEPDEMGIGPIPATGKLLARAGLDISDIALVELNEAFASQVLASARALGLDPERVNVNGGAIALGHPLGASGARLAGTLALQLRARGDRFGMATMCVGVGQGMSLLIENTDV